MYPYRYASVFKGCLTCTLAVGVIFRRLESKCYLGKVEAQAKEKKFVFCRRQHEAVHSMLGTWTFLRVFQGMGLRLATFSSCRFCMVYSEVPNFSEPNPEYSAQQAPNKTVGP